MHAAARRSIGKAMHALDEHFVEALAIASLVIISSMIAIHFATYQPERYTGFGVLNDRMEPGPFPANVTTSEVLDVYTNVLNREGKAMQYMVRVVVGSAYSTVDPVLGVVGGSSLVLQRVEAIVLEGTDWEQKISLRFNDTMLGEKKIFFELWVLELATASYKFTRQVLHVWMDVVKP